MNLKCSILKKRELTSLKNNDIQINQDINHNLPEFLFKSNTKINMAYWAGVDLFIIYFLHNTLPTNCIQKDGHKRNSRDRHATWRSDRTEFYVLDTSKINWL
jgi:hypothetical protein